MSIETTGREKSGRLLLVDDEQGVLQALKRLFYRHYDVVLANGGEEALSILETDPELLDARHYFLNPFQQLIEISDLHKRTLHGDVGGNGASW